MSDLFLRLLFFANALGLFVAAPLLAYYLKERVKRIAAESSEKVLADYKHQHETELASLNAGYKRALEEFSLYAKRRHAVYGGLYKRVRKASDRYASMIGLTISLDFRKFTRSDAEEYFKRHQVAESTTSGINSAFDRSDAVGAAKLLEDLHQRLLVHEANRAFAFAKNYEAINELYLSDDVRRQMEAVRNKIAIVAVAVEREDGRDRGELEKRNAMTSAVGGLFDVMRREIQRGE